jgi:hypothetical protein
MLTLFGVSALAFMMLMTPCSFENGSRAPSGTSLQHFQTPARPDAFRSEEKPGSLFVQT